MRETQCWVGVEQLEPRLLLSANISMELDGAAATFWANGYEDHSILDSQWANSGGVLLGQGFDQSKPTYRFYLPKKQLLAGSVQLYSFQVFLYGNASNLDFTDVLVGALDVGHPPAGEGYTSAGYYFGSSARSLLQDVGDGVGSYLDVTINSIDSWDYYDLNRVELDYLYDGINSSSNLTDWHEAYSGYQALLEYKSGVFDPYWEDVSFSSDIIARAIEHTVSLTQSVNNLSGSLWDVIRASGDFLGEIEEWGNTFTQVTDWFSFQPTWSLLGGFTLESQFSSRLNTAKNDLLSLASAWTSALTNGQIDNDAEKEAISDSADQAVASLHNLSSTVDNLAQKLQGIYNNSNSSDGDLTAGARLLSLSPFIRYTYNSGSDTFSQVGTKYLDQLIAQIQSQHFNIAPNQPSGISPSNGAANVSLTPTLQSSAFSDRNNGDTHAASEWQLSTNSSFTNVIWSNTDTDSSKTSEAVSSGTLANNSTYYWRVRHQDNTGLWSNWSSTRSFTTIQVPTPSAPTNVSATDGSYTDKVRVTWNTVSNATSYEVWRHTSDSSGSATLEAPSVSGTSWDDSSASPGAEYYYWVKSRNVAGTSGFSSSNQGYRQLMAPTGVSATDGTYADKVGVSWNAVTGATGYVIKRNTVNNEGSATQIESNWTSTTYDDTSVTSGPTYYYWVAAKTSVTTSSFSSDSGYLKRIDVLGSLFQIQEPASIPGQQITVDYEITNTGVQNTDWFLVYFYLSADNSISSSDYMLGSTTISDIASNSSSGTLSIILTLPPAGINLSDSGLVYENATGTYRLGMIVDASGRLIETEESNNYNQGLGIDSDSLSITGISLSVAPTAFFAHGINTRGRFGESVSSAGDINGDGFDDLIIGAPEVGTYYSPTGGTGKSYVIFGKSGGFSNSLELASLDGSNGFVINGIGLGNRTGASVSSAGDINGDGYDDLVIGAWGANQNGNYDVGESYVIFGKAAGFAASFDPNNLDGNNGFVINGIDQTDRSGSSVSAAGDINTDGYDDLIIGAIYADPNGIGEAGESYVVFGKAGGFAASFDLASLNGTNGFVLNGIYANDIAARVSSAGDINGDGFSDLAIGAPGSYYSPFSVTGETYVVFGKTGGYSANINLSTLNGTNGFVIKGIDGKDRSGASVSSAGDVNGDGFDDLIVGAPLADPNGADYAGESYVIYGNANGFPASLNLSSLDGTNGFVLNGYAGDFSGSVSGIGDFNGDGLDDIVIGASSADPNGNERAGASYVIFGRSGGHSTGLQLASLDGSNGFVINGIDASDGSGGSVSGAGDVNGDGFDDLIIGASSAEPNDIYWAGESYVIFGGDFTNAVTLNGTNGADVLTGTASVDVMIGGQSADELIGNGGADVLRGGEGNDILAISDLNYARLVGGNGIDMLRLDASALTLDLISTSNSRITGIEIIDIRGLGSNTLRLNLLEVLNLSGESNTLIVIGDGDDTLLLGPASDWTPTHTEQIGLDTFDVYTQGAATLKVSQDIQILIDGDLSGDRFVGIEDLNLVLGNWNQIVAAGDLSAGDASGDGFVGIEDLNLVLGSWNAALARPSIQGDLDGDGFVGISDLNIVLGNWNQTVPPGDPLADSSDDGFVGIEDLNTVLGNWNAGTPPLATAIATLISAPVEAPSTSAVIEESQAESTQQRRRQPEATTSHATESTRRSRQDHNYSSRTAAAVWLYQSRRSSPDSGTGFVPWALRHDKMENVLGLWEE